MMLSHHFRALAVASLLKIDLTANSATGGPATSLRVFARVAAQWEHSYTCFLNHALPTASQGKPSLYS